MLAAARGDQAQVQAIFDDSLRNATARGEGSALGLFWWLTALLHNGHGHYDEALAAAQQACEHEDVMAYGWALVELIEAGVRVGRPDEAAAALDRLSERTQASGTDWALGIEAGSRALLSEGQDAEPLYREAVERLARTRGVVHLARARLLYGEWLRRENRRVDAREQLRAAHEMFSDIGAEGFAERARHELAATGETARRRTDDARGVLTPQEAHIARLAKDGLSNPEIGAQLFISPRTVQYHLRKVFLKLDITSRNQLSRVPASQLKPGLATSHSGWRPGRCEAAPAAGSSPHDKSPSHQEGGGDMSYGFEWMPGVVLLGALLVLLIVPAFALIGLVVVALAAVAALVALAGAILASPYLLARTLRRRLAERHQPTGASVPLAV